MSRVSVVVETWNLGDAAFDPLAVSRALAPLLDALAPQLARAGAELVVTHEGLAGEQRRQLEGRVAGGITWVSVAPRSGYYDHKNEGFSVSRGERVAFLDGDCHPSSSWLSALLAPMDQGAQVVAGATSYAGELAPLANLLDFPTFDGGTLRPLPSGPMLPGPRAVRNFFANNVAFVRDVFAARRYPSISPMFHGQCQVLALRLRRDRVPIQLAPEARVTHAWPDGAGAWLRVRLLRGADTVSLLPYVVGSYAPGAGAVVRRMGPAPALAVLSARAALATWQAVRHGPVLRGLGLVAAVTAADSVGALAAPLVYRWLAPPSRCQHSPTP